MIWNNGIVVVGCVTDNGCYCSMYCISFRWGKIKKKQARNCDTCFLGKKRSQIKTSDSLGYCYVLLLYSMYSSYWCTCRVSMMSCI